MKPSRQLQGRWRISDGAVRTNIEQIENGTLVKYELDIIANKKWHKGLEERKAVW